MLILEPPWCCKSACISSKSWILFNTFWYVGSNWSMHDFELRWHHVSCFYSDDERLLINSNWGTFWCFQGVAILLLIWFGEKRVGRNFLWLMIGKSVFVKDKGFCLVLAYKELRLMFQNLWISLSDHVKDDWSPLGTLSEINPNRMKQFSSA